MPAVDALGLTRNASVEESEVIRSRTATTAPGPGIAAKGQRDEDPARHGGREHPARRAGPGARAAPRAEPVVRRSSNPPGD